MDTSINNISNIWNADVFSYKFVIKDTIAMCGIALDSHFLFSIQGKTFKGCSHSSDTFACCIDYVGTY